MRRKSAPRQPNGTVRGLPAEQVTKVLAALVASLELEGPTYLRQDAKATLKAVWGFDGPLADGLLLALERMPGVRPTGNPGEFALPILPEWHAHHRQWRFSPGRLNIAQALELLDLIPKGGTLHLEGLRLRLQKAVDSISTEDQ